MLFPELERRHVRRRRDRIAGGIGGHREVDPGEVRSRIVLRQLRQVVREDESDANHEVHAFGCEKPKA